MMPIGATSAAAALIAGSAAFAGTAWPDSIGARYTVAADIPYVTLSGRAQTLDFYRVAGPGAHPTVLLFHGGGWMAGDKATMLDGVLPWLARGWNVANVNYRLGSVAPAPAAVEDARCALHWLAVNAEAHDIDTRRIVVAGQSAGGHLALMAAMLPDGSAFDNVCRYGVAMPAERIAERSAAGAAASWWTTPVQVRAVVNFYGITDLAPLISGPGAKTYALAWLGTRAGDAALVSSVSPMTYVRPGLPPVITIHGDADPTVPVAQARTLHAALDQARVANDLVTVAGGRHGGFAADDLVGAWTRIDRFLASLPPAADAVGKEGR